MFQEDRAYLERRAEEELERARVAEETPVVQAHYGLACAYLDRLYPSESDD